MTKTPFHGNARRLSIATLLIVGCVVGDAMAARRARARDDVIQSGDAVALSFAPAD